MFPQYSFTYRLKSQCLSVSFKLNDICPLSTNTPSFTTFSLQALWFTFIKLLAILQIRRAFFPCSEQVKLSLPY